jgi:PD-(D/E)XK nuclease superfamily/Predicted AAA-ATPase
MMGFTHAEVREMLYQLEIPTRKIPAIMVDLKDWYDGYLFTADVEETLFNPNLVLYFLKEYSVKNKYPYEMLDANIMTDYRKIRNIFQIGGNETEKFALLDELVKVGYVEFPLTRVFNLEYELTDEDFLSLLFYMGMLTFKEAGSSDWRFEVPNYVIKKLYFEYFAAIFLEKTRFAKSHTPINRTIDTMMNKGNPEPFFKIVEYVLQENHSNRDELVYGEKHLQTLMIGLLFPYKAFIIHSEQEHNRGYPDIFLERVPDRNINFEVVIELKYIKKSDAKKLETVIAEVETQLTGYMQTKRFTRPDVRGFYVIFLGGEVHIWKEYGQY